MEHSQPPHFEYPIQPLNVDHFLPPPIPEDFNFNPQPFDNPGGFGHPMTPPPPNRYGGYPGVPPMTYLDQTPGYPAYEGGVNMYQVPQAQPIYAPEMILVEEGKQKENHKHDSSGVGDRRSKGLCNSPTFPSISYSAKNRPV